MHNLVHLIELAVNKSSPKGLARISQAFPLRAGKESVKYESAQYISSQKITLNGNISRNACIPRMTRDKLEKCGLGLA